MAIEYEKFLKWAESRWDGDVVVKGNEIKLNSPFTEDYSHKMWCNVDGGKKKRDNGVFHCWKSEERGSLISLVMFKDKCSYEEALEVLGGSDTFLAEAESVLDSIFYGEKTEVSSVSEVAPSPVLQLPPNTYLIDELNISNPFRLQAESHLSERKLPTKGYMICTGGELGNINYTNRLIIPYYDKYGDLIYFNSRYLGSSKKVPKYLGPPKELGIGKSDVLYFPSWPPPESKVFLTEGEFDSKVLRLCGLWSGAFGGKELGDKQIEILRSLNSNIVLCLDNDSAGKDSLPEIATSLAKGGMPVEYVRPSGGFKDWNQMYEMMPEKIIRAYVTKSAKPFDIFEWEIKTGKVAKNFLNED